ncbi:MAG: hypothetical protein ACKVTZ_09800 [Bacteroidia bacterium]
MRHFSFLIWAFWAVCLAFQGCQKDPNADIADIHYRTDFRRTDSLLYAGAKAFHDDSTMAMKKVYEQFLQPERDFWWEFSGEEANVFRLQIPISKVTPTFQDSILMLWSSDFLRNPDGYKLLDTIQQVFPNQQIFEESLSPLFKRVRKYLPNAQIPKIRTHVSGYDYKMPQADVTIMTPKYISVGLHYLLGENCHYYPSQIPKYISRRLDKKYLAVLVGNELVNRVVPEPETKETHLLAKTIHLGIRQYVLDKLLPNEPDSMKLYYTEKQMYWADYYEERIYKEIVPQLYSTDFLTYRKYLEEKPYTSDLSLESAPRLSQYFGWKVVASYMENHPKVTLEQLCIMQNYEQIFKESKYKP